MSVELDNKALELLNWRVNPAGEYKHEVSGAEFTFPVDALSTLRLEVIDGRFSGVIDSDIITRGALLLETAGAVVPLGYLGVALTEDGVRVSGHVEVLGRTLAVWAAGTLAVDAEGRVLFDPTSGGVGGVGLPGVLLDLIRARINPAFETRMPALGLRGTALRVEDGGLVLTLR